MPVEGRHRLESLARDMSFPVGARIVEEGGWADRFWVIHTGAVTLDLTAPGRRRAEVETLRSGDLLGWSWLFPPFTWHLGAQRRRKALCAQEFDDTAVRALCETDVVFGGALALRTNGDTPGGSWTCSPEDFGIINHAE